MTFTAKNFFVARSRTRTTVPNVPSPNKRIGSQAGRILTAGDAYVTVVVVWPEETVDLVDEATGFGFALLIHPPIGASDTYQVCF